ncbi:hypothetical protein TrRE_jg9879 [Triparma retinervis]|uniref:Uncharacterized protein n=1 Tax=Triparma retinervis TaxID=2557542 RepID=A0A9W6ZBJ8_9STRA|nr:hypothetical protein TrRE_jg9879 [Triparma retinervis]
MLAHFAAINVGLIDREGIMGTGTTTVLSWLIGWCFFYYKDVHSRGNKSISRALRYECVLLLTQLFVLAVGAGAFSRYYYGWINGHEQDIFQSLSLKYLMRHDPPPPPQLLDWWRASVTSRFVGVGWWTCEVVDPLCHQAPFLFLLYLTLTQRPAQRFFWDLSTCGTMVCDGPYHGFLSHISAYDQMFWHTFPGVLFFSYLFYVWASKPKQHSEPLFEAAAIDVQGRYSFAKSIFFILLWGLVQVIIAVGLMGGDFGVKLGVP